MLNLQKKPEHLLHELLPKLLAKKATASIPLTGAAAQSNDCYTIYFGDQYLVDGYNSNTRTLNVYTPDETGTFKIRTEVALSDALQYPLNVTYFYKTYWHDYTNIYRLARDYKMRRIQMEVRYKIFCNKISQWFFNKKPLWVIRDRMGLLESIIERHLGPEGSIASPSSDNTNSIFSAFQLMTELGSSKWIYHPHSSKAQRRLNLLLDAFVDSGDLRREGIGYTLAPRAIQTLEAYQESERHHRDAITTQKFIVILTFIIAIATIVQAYCAATHPDQSAQVLESHP